MTPMQAIMAGTPFSARACGVDSMVGTLEAGKVADILLVDGDPAIDIGAIANVRAVFKAGALVRDTAIGPGFSARMARYVRNRLDPPLNLQ